MKRLKVLNGETPGGVEFQLDPLTGVTEPRISSHLLVLVWRQYGPMLDACIWLRMAMANIDDPMLASDNLPSALLDQFKRCRHEETIEAFESWIESAAARLGRMHERTEAQNELINQFQLRKRAHEIRNHTPVA